MAKKKKIFVDVFGEERSTLVKKYENNLDTKNIKLVPKKKTRKQLNGKEVSTKGLYEQQYRTPHPLAWSKKKTTKQTGRNLLETSQLNEWLNKNTGVIEKADSDYIRDMRRDVDDIKDFVHAIFVMNIIVFGTVLSILVFAILN